MADASLHDSWGQKHNSAAAYVHLHFAKGKIMADPTTGNSPTPPDDRARTEADAQSVDAKSGKSNQSSHDAKSHTKAGSDHGAGGGKKQDHHHHH